jgi:hypothetical protein
MEISHTPAAALISAIPVITNGEVSDRGASVCEPCRAQPARKSHCS